MHLPFLSFIKGLFSFGSKPAPEPPKSTSEENYTYIRGAVENRGPCPGLNSLANHGYLPRDGNAITPFALRHALETALHMTPSLSSVLAKQVTPLLSKEGTFSLVDLRKHNILEHDASFTRLDLSPTNTDNYTLQPPLFAAMLADASPSQNLTIKSLAKTFKRRHAESPKLPLKLWFVSAAEAVAFFHGSQLGKELSVEEVRMFYEEERLSDKVLGNKKERTVGGLVGDVGRLLWWLGLGGK